MNSVTEQPAAPPVQADRFRSAAFAFVALAIVKIIFFFRTVGMAVRTKNGVVTPNAPAFFVAHAREIVLVSAVLYFLSAMIAFLISKGVARRLEPAVKIGTIYAALQIFSIVFVMQIGVVAVLNLILGFMAITNLHLARAFLK